MFPTDIYTEPEPDTDTLANLGPLTSMAGIWTSAAGLDVNPKPDGPEHQLFIERYELQPIDAQTNGPQLFYGLRYHTRIVKPDDPETFHDQVGYWLGAGHSGNTADVVDSPGPNRDGRRPGNPRCEVIHARSGAWFAH
jgi:hypothetical protein